MDRLLIINTLRFGLAKLFTPAVLLLVAILYGLSAEADRLLLALIVVGFPVGVFGLACEMAIAESRTLSHMTMLTTGCMFVFMTWLLMVLLWIVFDNPLCPWLFWGAVADSFTYMLSAKAGAEGRFWAMPVAQASGALALLGAVALYFGTGHGSTETLAWCISIGSMMRAGVLYIESRGIWDKGVADQGEFLKRIRLVTPKASLWVLSIPAIRIGGAFIGTGWVSGLTYVTALTISMVVLLTTGWRMTRGWRKAIL